MKFKDYISIIIVGLISAVFSLIHELGYGTEVKKVFGVQGMAQAVLSGVAGSLVFIGFLTMKAPFPAFLAISIVALLGAGAVLAWAKNHAKQLLGGISPNQQARVWAEDRSTRRVKQRYDDENLDDENLDDGDEDENLDDDDEPSAVFTSIGDSHPPI
jgi:xanthosine utilization system XapX-like protein